MMIFEPVTGLTRLAGLLLGWFFALFDDWFDAFVDDFDLPMVSPLLALANEKNGTNALAVPARP
ncbi:MAG: hypothetical protein WA154_14345 [Moraxellaceae bacterium]